MLSFEHECLAQLVRDYPAFAGELLAELLGVELPEFHRACRDDSNLSVLTAMPYHPDAVVLFIKEEPAPSPPSGRPAKEPPPVFGAIVEPQLWRDDTKRYTWPLYAVSARLQNLCRFAVVVIAPDPKIERWAAKTVDLGGGIHYWPLVIGRRHVPKVTRPEVALRHPQLSMLSAFMHGKGKVRTAVAIANAATQALSTFPRYQRMLYSLAIEVFLSEKAKEVFKMQPWYEQFLAEGRRRDLAEGEAKGLAEGEAKGHAHGQAQALLTILRQRGLTISSAQQRRIRECTDGATLQRWLKQALSVNSVTALIRHAERPRTRRVVLRTRTAPAGRRRRRRRRRKAS
jgi:hypothetical protein